MIAEQLSMEKEVVRVWFCNRRQKEKRINCPVATPIKPPIYNPRLVSDLDLGWQDGCQILGGHVRGGQESSIPQHGRLWVGEIQYMNKQRDTTYKICII